MNHFKVILVHLILFRKLWLDIFEMDFHRVTDCTVGPVETVQDYIFPEFCRGYALARDIPGKMYNSLAHRQGLIIDDILLFVANPVLIANVVVLRTT